MVPSKTLPSSKRPCVETEHARVRRESAEKDMADCKANNQSFLGVCFSYLFSFVHVETKSSKCGSLVVGAQAFLLRSSSSDAFEQAVAASYDDSSSTRAQYSSIPGQSWYPSTAFSAFFARFLSDAIHTHGAGAGIPIKAGDALIVSPTGKQEMRYVRHDLPPPGSECAKWGSLDGSRLHGAYLYLRSWRHASTAHTDHDIKPGTFFSPFSKPSQPSVTLTEALDSALESAHAALAVSTAKETAADDDGDEHGDCCTGTTGTHRALFCTGTGGVVGLQLLVPRCDAAGNSTGKFKVEFMQLTPGNIFIFWCGIYLEGPCGTKRWCSKLEEAVC
jgi:hypothetical protein